MAQLVGRCPHLVAHFSPCAPRLCFDRRQLSNPWRIGISHRAVPALHSATLIAGAKLALAVLSRQQSGKWWLGQPYYEPRTERRVNSKLVKRSRVSDYQCAGDDTWPPA